MRRPPTARQPVRIDMLPCVFPNAAGLDIGSTEIVVAVPPNRTAEPVRTFGTFTSDLHALVTWLVDLGIDTVALESTGIYWVPIYDLLEAHGITPYLVNVRHVKIVPGRKTDVNDAQWLQHLHMLGLLQRSFRPDGEILALRTLVRYRAELIQHRAPHILHMQKALLLMNLHLSVVLTDITGATGQAIIRAIVAGERDPTRLAASRNPACKASVAEIIQALTGTWQAEHLFVLQHALSLFDHYSERIAACDAELERMLITMESRGTEDAPLPDLPPAKGTSKSKNAPAPSTRAHLARIVGVDLVAITGLAASSVQTILAEIGTDMTRFPTVKHFCSWLGLAPRNDISGGKVLRSRTLKVVNRAAQALRQAAQSLARSHNAFGSYFRSMRARKGPQQAIVATAHKLARTLYFMLLRGEPFREESVDSYEQRRQERELRQLTRRAKKLGYSLTEAPPRSVEAST
ncbi:MAG: IS110 family transposase [Oscillochloris sp.]|nr:IS110 family transposase [Oscillochloris sp.]